MQRLFYLCLCLFLLSACEPATETASASPSPQAEASLEPAPPQAPSVNPDAPQGSPPNQQEMLLASFSGCFRLKRAGAERLTINTLQIDVEGNNLIEKLKSESLAVGAKDPQVTENTTHLKVLSVKETELSFEPQDGPLKGTQGKYLWKDSQFYVQDGANPPVGPFESCP